MLLLRSYALLPTPRGVPASGSSARVAAAISVAPLTLSYLPLLRTASQTLSMQMDSAAAIAADTVRPNPAQPQAQPQAQTQAQSQTQTQAAPLATPLLHRRTHTR